MGSYSDDLYIYIYMYIYIFHKNSSGGVAIRENSQTLATQDKSAIKNKIISNQ